MNKFIYALSLVLAVLLLSGCDNLSDPETQAELAAFLDGFDDEAVDEVSTDEALESDYIADESNLSPTGSSRLGGEISVSALSSRMLAKMAGTRSGKSRAQMLRDANRAIDALTESNFTVYWIDGKGKLTEVSKSSLDFFFQQDAGSNPLYIIDGVGDGLNYIVKISVTSNGQTLNLKSLSYVPPGAEKAPKAIVDPVSTVIAEGVEVKVKSGFFETGGDTFSQAYIKDVKKTLEAAIVEAISSGSGVTLQDFETALLSDAGIDDLVEEVLNDEDINSSLDKLEDAAVADTFAVPAQAGTKDEAKEIVEELFLQLDDGAEDGGAPGFVVNFFADRYAAGDLKTVKQIIDSIADGLEFNEDAADDGQAAPTFSAADALDSFTGALKEIYQGIARIGALESKDTLTDAEKAELKELREEIANVPDVILGVYPPEDKAIWLNLAGSDQLTVPQAIIIVFYIVDVYLADFVTLARGDNGQVEEQEAFDFNPFALLALYGFDPEDTTQQNEFASLDVHWLGVHPGRFWNPATQQEEDLLSMYTCVDAFPEERFEVTAVSVMFPTKTGTDTVSLTNESELFNHGGGDEGEENDHQSDCWALDPWAISNMLAESGNPRYGNQDDGFINWDKIWADMIEDGDVISDFASGSYKVTVSYTDNGTATTKDVSFEKRIISGLTHLNPVLTTPVAEPKYPQGSASQEQLDAYYEAIANFQPTTFAAPGDVKFAWTAPPLPTDLPEGIVAIYNLDVGRDNCETSEGGGSFCQWEHIFGTWELDKRIFGTKFTPPVHILERITPLELTDRPYIVNLNIEFIDENTGEFVGSGGFSSAPFRVGESIDLSSTFTISGKVNGAPLDDLQDDQGNAYPIDKYKVALIEESCEEDTSGEPQEYPVFDHNGNPVIDLETGEQVVEEFFPWVCTSDIIAMSALTADGDDHTYTLTPTMRSLMGTGAGKWVDIRLFVDTDGDGEVDQGGADGTGIWEPMFWADTWIGFDSWGGVLRIFGEDCQDDPNQGRVCEFFEETVFPDATYAGPVFNLGGGFGPGPGGDDGGGDDFGEPEIFLPPLSTTDTYVNDTLDHVMTNVSATPTFKWDLNYAQISDSDVDFFLIHIIEIDTSDPESPDIGSIMVVEAKGTKRQASFTSLSGAGTDDTDDPDFLNVTADVTGEQDSEFSGKPELDVDTLDQSKYYVWFVEAYRYTDETEEDDELVGESDWFVFTPGSGNNTAAQTP